jgi:uncharacterized glyoxalase superfamily protein PhnB
MSTVTETALQVKTITPNLTVDDLQASIGFFEALGFAVDERWEDKGTLNGVMLRAGTSYIGLSQDDWKKGRDRKKGAGMRIFIETAQDIDAIAKRAKQAGVKLDSGPQDTSWGSRAFEVTEPSGFLVTISSPS